MAPIERGKKTVQEKNPILLIPHTTQHETTSRASSYLHTCSLRAYSKAPFEVRAVDSLFPENKALVTTDSALFRTGSWGRPSGLAGGSLSNEALMAALLGETFGPHFWGRSCLGGSMRKPAWFGRTLCWEHLFEEKQKPWISWKGYGRVLGCR
jgi:hypothetical protein